MKYYAVRKGKEIGIFTDWETCKQAVTGFSGAEYKSFTSIEDAQLYINVNKDTKSEIEVNFCRCYVTVDCKADVRSIGIIIRGMKIMGLDVKSFAFGALECTPPQAQMLAICLAMCKAYELGYKNVEIIVKSDAYKWVTGEWSSKDKVIVVPLIKAVSDLIYKSGLDFSFRNIYTTAEQGYMNDAKSHAKFAKISANATLATNYISYVENILK